MDATKDSILIDGNTAAALGAVYAGATVGAWYPITPATSVMEAFKSFCMKYRRDPETKQKKFAILQAEDELAALGMVVGASWAGARAFTPTAGPGISLMNEFIGLAYYAEIPAVIVDVQRTGPSTGMPTRTQQGDLMMCAYASHGDTRHICLYPVGSARGVRVCGQGVRLAERFQTPTFLVSDLDIGMNDWMVPKLKWDDSYKPDRGKVLSAEDLEKAKNFWRYYDHDGDGIPQRSLPGVHPEGRVLHARLGPQQVRRLHRGRRRVPGSARSAAAQDPGRDARRCRSRSSSSTPGAKVGLVTVGGCHAACVEAMDLLAKDGIALNYMRVRGFPFGDEVRQFLEQHEVNFIVEQNRDAQLRSLLMLDLGVHIEKLESVRYYAGFPMSAHHVISGVKAKLEKVA